MLKRILIGTVMLAASVALAAPNGPGMRAGGRGIMGLLGGNVYPPEAVLRNRTALGLTDAQVTAIAKEIGDTHDKVAWAQDAVRAAVADLRGLLEKPQVDEAAALAAASRAIDLENQIKTAHLGMMIRVKNLLTPDQQTKMKDLRPMRRAMAPGTGGPTAPAGPEDLETAPTPEDQL
ncbi:MAG TPA: periplasmic heavy metal sensor [Candidatus Sulfotelmatobacter sp.]|nr:periplasmic heavy metal sensor [Candidatus Sulfotelmatobacter sp.]